MVARVVSKNIWPFGWYYSPMLDSDALLWYWALILSSIKAATALELVPARAVLFNAADAKSITLADCFEQKSIAPFPTSSLELERHQDWAPVSVDTAKILCVFVDGRTVENHIGEGTIYLQETPLTTFAPYIHDNSLNLIKNNCTIPKDFFKFNMACKLACKPC